MSLDLNPNRRGRCGQARPHPGEDGIWLGDTGELLNCGLCEKVRYSNGLLLYVRKREIVETGAAPLREPLPDWTPIDGQARDVRRCRHRPEHTTTLYAVPSYLTDRS